MKQYKYKISVIIPIYNVEKYLEETILSVINQTMNFEKYIQLILINDGSPDNSEDICLKYKELYPNNIEYVKQKNGGVSSARNKGMENIQGEYVNFLDSDDKWQPNALKSLYDFIKKHDEIDVVAGRIKFFDAKKGYHMLDYKFSGNYVADIHKNPEIVQLSLTSALIRATALEQKNFDTRLRMAEDAKLAFQIIFEKEKLGICKRAIYNYRIRSEQTSAMQMNGVSKHYYFDTLKHCHLELLEMSKIKYNKVIPYLQQFLIYDLRWRIAFPGKCNLNEEEKKEYLELIKTVLDHIDDSIIINQPQTNIKRIIKHLETKYQKDILKETKINDKRIHFRDLLLINTNELELNISILEVINNKLIIAGNFNLFNTKNIKMFYSLNQQYYQINTFAMINKEAAYVDPNVNLVQAFELEFDLGNISTLGFFIEIENQKYKLEIIPGKFSSLVRMKYANYFRTRNKLIYIKNQIICIKKNRVFNTIYWEFKYLLELALRKGFKVCLWRMLYWLTLPLYKKKNIWLVSDRYASAGDNGEALIKYIKEQNNPDIKSYFLLSKNSKDYRRMQNISNVVPYKSFKYKLLTLHSNFIISSHADHYVTNPFGKNQRYYQNIVKFKFVFLQHGIIQQDMSNWLNKYSKNIKLFVSSSKLEYESLIKGEYYYDESVVKLTGLPRMDYLINKNIEKQILILPTWRNSITKEMNENGIRKYDPNFINTEFYKEYSELINNSELLKVLKKYNYTIKFCLHPAMEQQATDFKGNNFIKVVNKCNYNEEFCKSKILITDYSSVAFDFTYLKKPILYFQFDIKDFFANHILKEGYFSYEKNGFGPVCYNINSLIDNLIGYIKNDGVIEQKYLKRINDFYKFIDKNNCKRVYDAIKKL